MSLKGFHIVFVAVCTFLCLFLALWSFVLAPEPSSAARLLGYVGVAGVILMPIYGVLFYRKAAKIIL
jgi:hypothetical protein